MRLLQKLIIALFFFSITFTTLAQQKYALLIGINRYYDAPGILHSSILQGCVNDANAMKTLLIDRFDFNEKNITTLLDAQATKPNVVNALLSILNVCKPGDAVVFYFSGHGVWMGNSFSLAISDPVKKGMNQAMVLSDLYEQNYGCLLTDNNIKKLFNKFIDKQVILTSFFDCCYSGELPMDVLNGPGTYSYPPQNYTEKSMDVMEIPSSFSEDGEQSFNELNAADTVNNNLSSALKNTPEAVDNMRSFNLKDAIKINDSERIPRPSERKNSMFFSLSATDEYEKGMEIKDEAGNFHGAFTKALLAVFDNNSSAMHASEIMDRIKSTIKEQMYDQSPTFHFDSVRLKKNLIGLTEPDFNKPITAQCIAVNKTFVTINNGQNTGLANGNVFKSASHQNAVTLTIINVGKDSAECKIKNGNQNSVKPADIFTLKDTYTISSPLIKIYIKGSNIDAASFNVFFKSKIAPLVKDSNYADFEKWTNLNGVNTFFCNNISASENKYLNPPKRMPFFIFLPMPSFLVDPLQNMLKKNQNIELVNSAEQADFILYLNYIKSKGDNKAGYVFTFQKFKPEGPEILWQPGFQIFGYSTKVSSLNVSEKSLEKLTDELYKMTMSVVRSNSTQWLNEYPRK